MNSGAVCDSQPSCAHEKILSEMMARSSVNAVYCLVQVVQESHIWFCWYTFSTKLNLNIQCVNLASGSHLGFIHSKAMPTVDVCAIFFLLNIVTIYFSLIKTLRPVIWYYKIPFFLCMHVWKIFFRKQFYSWDWITLLETVGILSLMWTE